MEKITPIKVANTPARPLMIFDGDCGFCRYWVERWRHVTAGRVDYEASQDVGAQYPEIPPGAFAKAVQFVEKDGSVAAGADAVFKALKYADKKGWLLDLLIEIPGFPAIARIAYKCVASNRTVFSFFTRLLFSRRENAPTYFVARWMFMRLIGVIYLIAFGSLLMQITGLAGKNGIVPVADFLQMVREHTGSGRYWLVPSICWLDASDQFLKGLCISGMGLACAVILDFFPSLCLLLMWGIYLSLCSVCSPFLNFQWDTLLLETGFLAIFLVPPVMRPSWKSESGGPRVARWLLLWLLFCLMFESGVVKLSAGDPCWWDFTALNYHYQTQPLPIWTSWYLNQEPEWFAWFSVLLMFCIKIFVPFTIFGGRVVRRVGCGLLVFLQLFIAATGNYCFFNLLTIALCLLLLDDAAWPRWCSEKLLPRSRAPAQGGLAWLFFIVSPVAAVDLFLSGMQLAQSFEKNRIDWPQPIAWAEKKVEPFRTFNSYGLFRVMSRERPEIIIEGSNDFKTWKAYDFKWKPGDVNGRPGLVAPFQPRLDWQMWFAAPNDYRSQEWFILFMKRLLEGSPDVVRLMGSDPFPGTPPRYIRAGVYDYKFTRFGDDTQAWWKREYMGLYCPILSLHSGAREGE